MAVDLSQRVLPILFLIVFLCKARLKEEAGRKKEGVEGAHHRGYRPCGGSRGSGGAQERCRCVM